MAALNKYGVPVNSTSGGRGGILMPKLKYRFRVSFTNFGPTTNADTVVLTQQVMRADKPKISFEEVTLDSYVSKSYVHGKHTWETVTVTLRDDITNGVAKIVGEQVQKQVNHFEQTSFQAGMNYKFLMMIEILDGGNGAAYGLGAGQGILEQWELDGCWLQNVSYEDLDYTASEVQQITLTIRFDNATQMQGVMPVGTGSGGATSGGLGFVQSTFAVSGPATSGTTTPATATTP